VVQEIFACGEKVGIDSFGDEVHVPCGNGKGYKDALVGLAWGLK
jgi:hypothetical protein